MAGYRGLRRAELDDLRATTNRALPAAVGRALADKLRGTKSKNVNVFFDYLPLENHATIMHQAIMNAFKFLYPIESK